MGCLADGMANCKEEDRRARVSIIQRHRMQSTERHRFVSLSREHVRLIAPKLAESLSNNRVRLVDRLRKKTIAGRRAMPVFHAELLRVEWLRVLPVIVRVVHDSDFVVVPASARRYVSRNSQLPARCRRQALDRIRGCRLDARPAPAHPPMTGAMASTASCNNHRPSSTTAIMCASLHEKQRQRGAWAMLQFFQGSVQTIAFNVRIGRSYQDFATE